MRSPSPTRSFIQALALLAALVVAPPVRAADAVQVTLVAGKTMLLPGERTTLTAYGQVSPDVAADSLRILTWYLDLVTGDAEGSVISVDWPTLTMPESDSPDGSSTTSDGGSTDAGDNRRGIHNTFLNPVSTLSGEPNPGRDAPIALFSVEVVGVGPGSRSFSVAPGSMVDGLTFDFQVARDGGGSFTGGDYETADLTISVGGEADPDALGVTLVTSGSVATLTFSPQAGFNHLVQSSTTLATGSWSDLPAGADGDPDAFHNSGTVTTPVDGIPRLFFRVLLLPMGGL